MDHPRDREHARAARNCAPVHVSDYEQGWAVDVFVGEAVGK